MMLAPGTLVMAASTFVYFQALIGPAKEVHYPGVGFFHNQHNICMRRKKVGSHFGQMRLPFPNHADKRVVFHDIYSRHFFLTYDQFTAQSVALPCEAIFEQHVCPGRQWQFCGESRYCYRDENSTTLAAAKQAHAIADSAATEATKAGLLP